MTQRRRRQKYGAVKTQVDGITFDSKAEAKRYQELKLLERAGVITDLELQPKFVILPKHKDIEGKTVREMSYFADFSYFDIEKGKYVIEDVKGVKTAVYKLKKKLVEYKHDVKITEV